MTDLYISHHCIERYQQRVGSTLPVDTLRDWLVELVRPAALIGARRYAVDGFTFILRRTGPVCAVTTVLEGSLPRSRGDRRAPRSELSRREAKRLSRRHGKRAGR